MCVSAYVCVCVEHLTAKDLKSHESILLMRVLELREEGQKASHPVLSICLSLLLSHLLPSSSSSLSPYAFLLSFHLPFVVRTILLLSLLPLSLSPFPPFLRPTSRRQVVANRTIIPSSQMHFAPLLHSDKLNIPSKHFFQDRRHLMFCLYGSANLTSGPLDSQTAFYLHRRILQSQNLHALKTHSAVGLQVLAPYPQIMQT